VGAGVGACVVVVVVQADRTLKLPAMISDAANVKEDDRLGRFMAHCSFLLKAILTSDTQF
jgi:hypothetical protein